MNRLGVTHSQVVPTMLYRVLEVGRGGSGEDIVAVVVLRPGGQVLRSRYVTPAK